MNLFFSDELARSEFKSVSLCYIWSVFLDSGGGCTCLFANISSLAVSRCACKGKANLVKVLKISYGRKG